MKRTLSVIAAIGLGAPCFGQWYWPPTGGLQVSPGCIIPTDRVSLTVSGLWPDACEPNHSSSQVNGNEIDITVIRDPPPLACPQIVTSWSRTETVGPLPVGTYTVYARYETAGSIVLPLVQVGSFHVVAQCCYANCDNSTSPPILNANDFQCFLNEFAAGDPAANCDGSTSPPILNANDFQCFINAFAAGC